MSYQDSAGRVVRCTLSPEPMHEAALWLSRYQKFWSGRLDALGRYLYQQEELQSRRAEPPTSARRSRSAAAPKPRRKKSGARGPSRKR